MNNQGGLHLPFLKERDSLGDPQGNQHSSVHQDAHRRKLDGQPLPLCF